MPIPKDCGLPTGQEFAIHRRDGSVQRGSLARPAAPQDPAVRDALGAYAQNDPAALPPPVGCVAEVMAHGMPVVRHDAPAAPALRLLEDDPEGVAVVGGDGRLVGLLLRPDAVPPGLRARSAMRNGRFTRAADVMVTPVPAVAAHTALGEVAAVLQRLGLRGLPVTDDRGGVVGYVGRDAIAQAAANAPQADSWA